jgi:hypothetical protein
MQLQQLSEVHTPMQEPRIHKILAKKERKYYVILNTESLLDRALVNPTWR